MRYLPVGLDVRGRTCLVVGGGKVGTRKVRNLHGAGASVTLVAPQATRELARLADSGAVRWIREPFREDHLRGFFLVVAATDDDDLNTRLAGMARELGALVCDASSAERSQVIFGALHRGEGFTVAVFTDGRDPSRAREVRDRIAAVDGGWGEGGGPEGAGRPGAPGRGGVPENPPRDVATGEPRRASQGRDTRERGMLILMAHGSRDPVWRDSLAALTRSVGASLPGGEVRLAFMQFTGPTLPEIVREGLSSGHTEFRILPLFMASAGHVDKDIKPLVERLAAAHPEARLEILTPLGKDALLPHLIVDIASRPPTRG